MRQLKKMTVNYKHNFRLDSGSFFVLYTSLVMMCYLLPALKITIPYIHVALLMLVFFPIAMIKMQNNLGFFIVMLVATSLSAIFYFVNGIYGLSDAINEAIRYIRFFSARIMDFVCTALLFNKTATPYVDHFRNSDEFYFN